MMKRFILLMLSHLSFSFFLPRSNYCCFFQLAHHFLFSPTPAINNDGSFLTVSIRCVITVVGVGSFIDLGKSKMQTFNDELKHFRQQENYIDETLFSLFKNTCSIVVPISYMWLLRLSLYFESILLFL